MFVGLYEYIFMLIFVKIEDNFLKRLCKNSCTVGVGLNLWQGCLTGFYFNGKISAVQPTGIGDG